MDEKIERLFKWSRGEKALPYRLDIMMYDGCNQSCKFCFRHFEKAGGEGRIKESEYLRVIDESVKLKIKEICINGYGEPFFDKQKTLNMMEKIKDYNILGEIFTNGTLLNESDIKRIVEIEWDTMLFSIHGPDAATHDYLVSLPGAFDRAINNIKFINKWKKKLRKDKPYIIMTCVLTNKNYDKIKKLFLLSKKLNVKLIINSLNVFDEKLNNLLINKSQLIELKKDTKEIEKYVDVDYAINNSFSSKKPLSGIKLINKMISNEKSKINFLNSLCFAPWYKMVLNDFGNIVPCYSAKDEGENINNKSLREIWFGEYFEKLRNDILNRNPRKYCNICPDINLTKHILNNMKLINDL